MWGRFIYRPVSVRTLSSLPRLGVAAAAASMYSREVRYRDSLSKATPWMTGPSRIDERVEPVAADPGLSLIAMTAAARVAGHTNMATSAASLMKGRAASIMSASMPTLRHFERRTDSVSYTHLTLPTIPLV